VADTFSQKHRPTEIRLRREEKILDVDFEDGVTLSLPAELLRVESPSAEVQGHSPSQKKTVAGRRHVGIMGVESEFSHGISSTIWACAKMSYGMVILLSLKLKVLAETLNLHASMWVNHHLSPLLTA